MLRKIYNWTMELADHRLAVVWLAVVSFIESSVFPIPPDAMLIPMILANRNKAWKLAAVATIASVAGGWLGYGIGYKFYEIFGQKIIGFYHLETAFALFQAKFNQYGAWIVLLKGMTPIPYKLITISAGAVHLDPVIFTISSIGARAMRFFLVAALLQFFGEPIRLFIEKRLTLVTTLFVALIVVGFLVLKLV